MYSAKNAGGNKDCLSREKTTVYTASHLNVLLHKKHYTQSENGLLLGSLSLVAVQK